MINNVNYKSLYIDEHKVNLRWAANFYSFRGYEEVYVPTLVNKDIINSTCPVPEDMKTGDDFYHVASAEQGFIQMLYEGWKPEGSYFSMTACQRPYDKDRGELYQEWFIKLELFHSQKNKFFDLLGDARDCYSVYFGVPPNQIDIQHTNIGLDLYYKDVEIGSYGMRTVCFEKDINLPYNHDEEDPSHKVIETYSFAYGTGFVPYRLSKIK